MGPDTEPGNRSLSRSLASDIYESGRTALCEGRGELEVSAALENWIVAALEK